MPNPFAKPSKKERFLKVLKAIFFTKLPMNLLFLLIIIILAVVGFEYMKPGETPTGYAVLEQECTKCICEEADCEPDCDLCPIKTKVETKNVIYYKCPGGALVKDLDNCVDYMPNVSDEYSGTVESITLSIDDIEIEEDEEDSGFVTKVHYTIINRGDFPIVPQIQVKVYEDWSLKAKKAPANKILNPEIVINANDYVKRQDRVRIYFKGEEQTLRLLLVDALTDPDTEVLAVTRDFELD